MADKQIIALLPEIRDLQKQHVENDKNALKNQQESIEIPKRGRPSESDFGDPVHSAGRLFLVS